MIGARKLDATGVIDISIPLRFNGLQPGAFGAEAASSEACRTESLVGDTRHGGSCNFEQYTLIPHCNGTHTECVGHITHERISIRDCLRDVITQARLVSVAPEEIDGDLVITPRGLREIETRIPADSSLIVRTLPNDESKLSRNYDEQNIPPYFSADAIELVVKSGVKHLLVDVPSIDRLVDGGKLRNHRIFWNVQPGSFKIDDNTRVNSTITELIYVPADVADGMYALNLQIAPFEADAAPSRPLIWPI